MYSNYVIKLQNISGICRTFGMFQHSYRPERNIMSEIKPYVMNGKMKLPYAAARKGKGRFVATKHLCLIIQRCVTSSVTGHCLLRFGPI